MSDSTTAPAPDLNRLLRPRSVAIVGASPQPGQLGNNVLANLERCGYRGEIHLVSRNRTEINGRPCVPTIDDLPAGIDAVVLVVPEVAVLDAVAACARRGVGGIVTFAAGFAEMGEEGRAKQDRLVALARAGGIALNGPNCSGLVNFVDGVPLTFEPTIGRADIAPKGVGIVAQSGGMMGNIRIALKMKGVPTAYCFSTGNEAALGLEDFFEYLLNGEAARVFALFIEQVRHPRRFLDLIRRARELRRPVVMMHPGRTQRAREAALSHTGALAGDHAVMTTVLRREGVLVVDTLDEFFDATALLVRWPEPPAEGAAIMTNSGAFRGVALDFGIEAGLELPRLAASTRAALAAAIPAYATADNPLDLTTIGVGSPEVFGRTAEALLDDPAIGGLITAFMPGAPQLQLARAQTMLPVFERSGKPVAFAHFCDGMPLTPEFTETMRQNGMPLFSSPDRAMRAMARLADYGRILRQPAVQRVPPSPLPRDFTGTIPEYRAKQFLAAKGVPVAAGALARDAAEAEAVAARIGYPIALKAQAAALAHKSDVGGVILNITDAAALRAGWDRLQTTIARARPELRLDGVRVEKMAAPGLEMILGARRDPEWGPILMLGLGGLWTEALKDVRLMPPDLDEDGILAEIGRLKGAALLAGMRGAPPLDARAVAATAAILGRIIGGASDLKEIEVNPLAVYPSGVVALDALMHVA
jgi:acetate---CoA ligase (ADP-forming)